MRDCEIERLLRSRSPDDAVITTVELPADITGPKLDGFLKSSGRTNASEMMRPIRGLRRKASRRGSSCP